MCEIGNNCLHGVFSEYCGDEECKDCVNYSNFEDIEDS